MRLIDADRLRAKITAMVTRPHQFMYEIERAPTVDAEPVVRCKDCRFFYKYGFKKLEYTECTHFDCDVTENGYCWWGERK